MRRTFPLSSLLLCLLLPAPVLHAECNVPRELSIAWTQGAADLEWHAHYKESRWRVEIAADCAFSELLCTAEVESAHYTYFHDDLGVRSAFFRVYGIEATAAGDVIPIEDFECDYSMTSWGEEDQEPRAWDFDSDEVYHGERSLRLFGNTVKSQPFCSDSLGLNTVYRVAARCSDTADRQMIGFADSSNVLWYVLWGTLGGYPDSPGQGLQETVTTYQGWFPRNEWAEILLPVGKDWAGKYGYYPVLSTILWANECDTNDGEVRFDQLCDVTGQQSSCPLVEPAADDLEVVVDSVRVRLWNTTPSDSVTHVWTTSLGQCITGDDVQLMVPVSPAQRVILCAYAENGASSVSQAIDLPGTSGEANDDYYLGFGGDVMTARWYETSGFISNFGVDSIYAGVRPFFESMDLMMVNLECPYTNASVHHPTKSIYFKANPANLVGVRNAGIDYVTLANNHAFDYLLPGMLETMSGLDTLGVIHNGCGRNEAEALRPVVLGTKGRLFGLVAMSDRTGNYNNYQPYLDAGASRPGFALWSRANMLASIPDLREKVDVLIVQVHSGNEYSSAPTLRQMAEFEDEDFPFDPNLRGLLPTRELLPGDSERRIRQEAIDMGADLVITHHPHILQGVECYNGGLIAHSLGNLIMDLSYAETQVTAVLEVNSRQPAGNAFAEPYRITPVFIRNNLPVILQGGQAQGVMRHIARMSWEGFDTSVLLGYDYAASEAANWCWALPAGIYCETLVVNPATVNLEFVQEEESWISAPVFFPEGNAEDLDLSNLPDSIEVRFGRDLEWWGNMEDEGFVTWDMNSENEEFTDAQAYHGERSLYHHIGAGYVATYFVNRWPVDGTAQYTLAGWIKTDTASAASVEMRWYNHRTDGSPFATQATDDLTGTNDWTYCWKNLDSQPGATFYQLRLMTESASSSAEAWYDDVQLIEWDEWQTPATDVVYMPVGGDWHVVQFRYGQQLINATVQMSSAYFTTEESD